MPAATAEKLLPSASLTLNINGVDCVTNKNIVSLETGWKNNIRLDAGFFPGSGFQAAGDGSSGAIRGRLEFGNRAGNLRFVARFENGSSEYTKLKAQTTGTAVIHLQFDANNSLDIAWQKVAFSTVEVGGILTVAVDCAPMYDSTGSYLAWDQYHAAMYNLGGGRGPRRFRWDRGMGLDRVRGTELLPGQTYVFGEPGRKAAARPQAARVRASNADGSVAVEFYFGRRGFEFDVELAPDASDRARLESLDGDLAVDDAGGVSLDGRRLLARPVAYTVDARGVRHPVEASFAVSRRRVLEFRVGARRTGERLVIVRIPRVADHDSEVAPITIPMIGGLAPDVAAALA